MQKRVYNDFPLKIFSLTRSKNFVGEPFGVSESFWYRKILWMREGREGVSRFLSKLFCLTVNSNKNFRKGTLTGVKKILVSKLFMYKRGVSQFSVVIIRLKNVEKNWDSNPYLPLQNLVVLLTVPGEPLEFLTNVSEIIKLFGTTEIRTRT